MSRFRVDKVEVRVLIAHADGSSVGGSLFLSPDSPAHTGPQTVLDLLEEGSAFLPLKNDRGDVLMIGKAGIVSVHAERPAGDAGEFTRPVSARLRLLGGHTLSGQLMVPLVDDAFRVLDHLNGPDAWLRLERDDALYWVRKAAILELRA